MEASILALYDRCEAYFLMTSGEKPLDCQELFDDLPPDTPPEAKEVFGIFEADRERLLGVVDYVGGFPDPGTVMIGLLLIDPEERGRGVGRQVVDALGEKARGEGRKKLRVAVIEANAPAYAFWKRVGFSEVLRTEPRSYGKKRHRVIAIEKPLLAE
jgi:GNAT superfamily N-acetyltransferase